MESCSFFDDLLLSNSPSSSSINNNQDVKLQWCSECYNQAQEMENSHRKSIDMIKKKILCTDHLIGMYTQMKSSYEESQMQVKSLKIECRRKGVDNILMHKQLKALLADNDPTELQQLKEKNANLELTITNLNDYLCSLEMTKKMLELKITSLNDELKLKETESKTLLKEKEQLQKDLAKQKKLVSSCKRENLALSKKNEALQERLRRRRSRESGSFSHTTDSEHNLTAPLEDFRTENDEASQNSSIFKSPLPERKKKRMQKRRKSLAVHASDDEDVTDNNQEQSSASQIDAIPEPTDVDPDMLARNNPTKKEIPMGKKNRVRASSSNSANETTMKRDVATSSMKARLLNMKKNRAYRSFCNRPSSTQLKEISEIVNRMKEDPSSLKQGFDRFCAKHFLTGHENFVARKIERLHQESLDPGIIDKLRHLPNDASNVAADSPAVQSNQLDLKENKENCSKLLTNATIVNSEQLKAVDEPDKSVIYQEKITTSPKSTPETSASYTKNNDVESSALSTKNVSPVVQVYLAAPMRGELASTFEDESMKLTTEKLSSNAEISSVASSTKKLSPIAEVESATLMTKNVSPVVQVQSVTPMTELASAAEIESVQSSIKNLSPVAEIKSAASSMNELFPLAEIESTVLMTKEVSPHVQSEAPMAGELASADKIESVESSTRKLFPTAKIKSAVSSTEKLSSVIEAESFTSSTNKLSPVAESESGIPLTKELSIVFHEPPATSPVLKRNRSSMFSSDDDTDEPVKVNICSANDPSEIRSFCSTPRRRRTRSDSRSGKSLSNNDKILRKKQIEKSKAKPKKVSKKSEENEPSVNIDALPISPAVVAAPSIKISSFFEFSTDSDSSDSVPLSVLVKRSKSKLPRDREKPASASCQRNKVCSSTAIDELNMQLPAATASILTSSVTETQKTQCSTDVLMEDSNTTFVTTTAISSSSKRKKIDSSPVDKKIVKLDGPDKDQDENPISDKDNRRPPTLKSFQSMPFSVEQETQPSNLDSPSHAFLPASGSNLNLFESSDNDQRSIDPIPDLISPSKLQGIFHDMTALMDMSLLSPLRSDDRPDSSSDSDLAFNPDVDDRGWISPSADLCTAISFPSVESKLQSSGNKKSSPKGSKSQPKTSGSEAKQNDDKTPRSPVLKDAPRRFSCEAPVLARTVPTVKRVCKAQSLDPAVFSSIDETPSKIKETSLSDAALMEVSPTSKILPSNLKIITGTYSGPFKVVSSGSPHADTAPNPDVLIRTESKSSAETDPIPVSVSVSEPTESRTKECHVILESFPLVEGHIAQTRSDSEAASASSLHRPTEDRISNLKKSSMKSLLEEIQSHAFLMHPNKTYTVMTTSLIVDWLTILLPRSRDHNLDEALALRAKTNSDLSSLQLSNITHEEEYQFIMMIVAVDRTRAKAGREIIKSLVVPTIMKLLCRFGCSLFSSSAAIRDTESTSKLNKLLTKGNLDMSTTRSLVRLLSCFCRSVASPDVVVDFCRYAIVSKSLLEIDPLLFECIACYPDAFSKLYRLSGTLLISTLASRADKHIYNLKSEEFKEKLKSRVRNLESLLGLSAAKDESMAVEQVRDDKSRKVLEQCMHGIKTASFSSFIDVQSSDSEVVLSGPNLNDIFVALELFASTKSLLFVIAEIIDRKFWPLLNSWSRHLVTQPNDIENKQVSDASIAAVLHGITSLLLTLTTKQQLCHPMQPFMKQTVAYFDTMCSLLANFTARHLETAPLPVQCATATTVLKLAFYKPQLAYKTVHEWLEGTKKLLPAEKRSKRGSRKAEVHPCLSQIVVFYPDKSLKKMVAWLELQTKSFRREKNISTSLTTLIWG